MWEKQSLPRKSHLFVISGLLGLLRFFLRALLPASAFTSFFPPVLIEVLVQGASPHHAVGCKVLSGIGVDVKCFHVSLADILVAQLWAAFGSPSRCQLSIEKILWDAAILPEVDMPQPTAPSHSSVPPASGCSRRPV